jgi:hypothetical protein
MSNASSPHQGGPTPSSSTQANPVRYNPYQKPAAMAMMASNGRPAAMMSNPMCAMASNGQMVMANQVQIGNPAQLQARLGTPYMAMTPNGQMVMMAAGQTPQMGMIANPAGLQAGQIMMTPSGQMVQAAHPGQIQVQYVQPPVHGAISAGQTAQYSSQPVSYSATQAAAASSAAQPPPPPQGNPPNSTSEQGAGCSRSSTPQTKGNSEAGHVIKNGADESEGGGAGRVGMGGPDFNQENERLQNLVKGTTG